MRSLRAVFARFLGLFRRKRYEAEMNDELRAHLDGLIERNLAAGMTANEARAGALRMFGGVEQIKESARDERRSAWAENFFQDLRYAARQLGKTPGFTVTVVLTLALGIGANTAMFSLVDEVLLKPLTVKQPEQLVLLSWRAPPIPFAERAKNVGFTNGLRGGWTETETKLDASYAFSMLAFDRFREHSRTLAEVFGFYADSEINVIVDGQAEISNTGQYVTGGYYTGLGVNALLGRTIAADDEHTGAAPVAVISHGFWQRRFGGSPSVIGKTITVNRQRVTIVGVTPPEFHGALEVGQEPDVSLPLVMVPDRTLLERPTNHWWLRIMGRLRPGTTREQAQTELAELFRASVQEGLAAMAGWRAPPPERLLPALRIDSGAQGLNRMRPFYRRSLATLTGLVGLVLLLACANVANLLLARGAARRRELAVRLALGAGRGRLVRQLLAESCLLALLGGAGGVLLAWWGKDVLVALWGVAGPGVLDPAIDRRVLGFALGIAVITCGLVGLVPAWRATRLDLATEFQGGARTAGSRANVRTRRVLTIAQVALSVILLVAAGLFGRTLRQLHREDIGFNRERLLLFRVDATPAGYPPARFPELQRRLSENIEALPGVRSATLSAYALFGGGANQRVVWLPGRPRPAADGWASVNAVGPGFFATTGMPIIAGREFGPQDARATKVAIINQSLARKYFGNENPIGRRFSVDYTNPAPKIEVIGVVRDAKWLGIREVVSPTMYFPFTLDHLQSLSEKWGQMNFAVRTTGEPAATIAMVRQAVRGIDSTLPVTEVRTLDEQIDRTFAQERLFAQLSACFGVTALALACVGLYGLMSFVVLSRTGEIGVRMALGALPRRILTLVLRESLVLVVYGVLIGMTVAWATTRWIAGMLYGLSPADPLTYGAVALLLLAVGLLASGLPARRAAKVDPMTALRAE